MKIIVAGCGKIGTAIIGALVQEGHDVTAVDIDPEVISSITDVYDVMTVVGSCVDYDTLKEAGAETARLFISMTPSDEVNILSCFLARRMGSHHTVVRIESPDRTDSELAFIKQQTNVSMFLNPSKLVASELENMLKIPTGIKAEYFARRSFEMVEVKLKDDSKLTGMTLLEMRKKHKGRYLIGTVLRDDQVFIPRSGDFVMKSGDQIAVTALPSEINKLIRSLGYLADKSRRVMILGGSRTASHLGRMLIDSGISVKIIEEDKERCRQLCESMPEAVIIHGDGAQGELLSEEGLGSADAFVTLTGMDEENLLMALYARSQNVPKALCKVDRLEFTELAGKMGIDDFVSPKLLISNMILRYTRALENSKGSNIETLYKLMDGKAEALEFNVRQGFPYTGIPLQELGKKMKKNILIGGIIRGNKSFTASAQDIIEIGDRVVVLAAGHQLHDLADIMEED